MKQKSVFLGIVAGSVALIALGIPTALVPTGLFARMIPATVLDYIFLLSTAGMIGTFSFYSFQKHSIDGKGGYAALGGTVGSVFAFGCSVCNAILVSAFGTFAILAYFEPFRPFLGVASITILAFAIHSIRKSCSSCKTNKRT